MTSFEQGKAFWEQFPPHVRRELDAIAWLEARRAERLLEKLKKMPGTNMDLKHAVASKLRTLIAAGPPK